MVEKRDTSDESPKAGSLYKSPVNVLGTDIENFNIPSMGIRLDRLSVKERGGEIWHTLSYQATDFERTWEILYIKMETFITSLSIGIFSHCWLSDYLYDEDGREVWRKPGTIRMVVEKEGDPLEKEPTPAHMATTMIDLSVHISKFYPRVFLYHYIGLLLMRTPLVGFNLNGEILLNFFKVGELLTTSRTGAKPTLKNINAVTKALDGSYSASEVREFYKVRSRDAAHDYQQAQNIERELAIDCKLWSEELIVRDWMDRGEELVKRSPQPRFPLRQTRLIDT